MSEPTQVLKRAIDVTPHYHGIWCTVGGSEPFVNAIVSRRWSDDGHHISFMLDTHNFDRRAPDEEMRVVELTPRVGDSTRERWARSDAKAMARRPSYDPLAHARFMAAGWRRLAKRGVWR